MLSLDLVKFYNTIILLYYLMFKLLKIQFFYRYLKKIKI